MTAQDTTRAVIDAAKRIERDAQYGRDATAAHRAYEQARADQRDADRGGERR